MLGPGAGSASDEGGASGGLTPYTPRADELSTSLAYLGKRQHLTLLKIGKRAKNTHSQHTSRVRGTQRQRVNLESRITRACKGLLPISAPTPRRGGV